MDIISQSAFEHFTPNIFTFLTIAVFHMSYRLDNTTYESNSIMIRYIILTIFGLIFLNTIAVKLC